MIDPDYFDDDRFPIGFISLTTKEQAIAVVIFITIAIIAGSGIYQIYQFVSALLGA